MEIPKQDYQCSSPPCISSRSSPHWYFIANHGSRCKRAAILFRWSFGLMAVLVAFLKEVSLMQLFTQSKHDRTSRTTWEPVNQNQEKLKHESFQLLSSLQKGANTLLSSFEDHFNDLPYTSYKAVMENGFPMQWDDCVVPKAIFHHHQRSRQTGNSLGNISSSSSALQHQKKAFRIVVVGGSASARPPKNCHIGRSGHSETDFKQHRYSNQLEKVLNQDLSSNESVFQVDNMAQGNTDSGFTAWILDQLVDPTNVDMIVWEFSINDMYSKAVPEELLKFWFQRATALFALAGQSRLPPIIMLYLWDLDINDRPHQDELRQSQVQDSIPRNYSSSSLRRQWETIQYYKSNVGWDIQVVHVGASLDTKTVLQKPSIVFDDKHHPSCKGTQGIISMIQHALYSNIAFCKIHPSGTSNTDGTKTSSIPLMTALSLDEEKQRLKATIKDDTAISTFGLISKMQPSGGQIFDYLSRNSTNTRVASLTRWEPRHALLNNINSGLKIAGNLSSLDRFVFWNARRDPGRLDQKFGFRVPPCGVDSANTHSLEITVEEPTLQWIGLHYSANEENPAYNRDALELSINGVHAFGGSDTMSNNSNHDRFNGTDIGNIQTWVYLPDILGENGAAVSENVSYTISLCQHGRDSKFFIHHFIGVMEPQQLEGRFGSKRNHRGVLSYRERTSGSWFAGDDLAKLESTK